MDSVGSGGLWPDAEPLLGGKRVRGRDSLFLLARLTIEGEPAPVDVRVRNLSAGGLMAELDRVLPVGTPITVELRGIGAVPGQAAWCAERRVGITFTTPIDPKRARQPVGGGTTTPTYTKPVIVRG